MSQPRLFAGIKSMEDMNNYVSYYQVDSEQSGPIGLL